jgi:phage/plasmid primase-like uncharacterized protein
MKAKNIESSVVRNEARGSWLFVLSDLLPELDRAIEKPGTHVGCPSHGGQNGFRLFRDADVSGGGICNTCGVYPDGFSLLMWLRGWSFHDALCAVADTLGISSDTNKKQIVQRPAFVKPDYTVNDAKITATLRKVWSESKAINHPDAKPVRLYLQSRGLDEMIPNWPSLRFHPHMQYRDEDGKFIGCFPAILALVERDNEAITIHRTFLTWDGCKAPVDSPKKMMPVPSSKIVMGSCIRLGTPGRVLCVTEGFETALAVIEATGMVTWPLISSTLMSGFIIPVGVEKLIIWSDLDRSLAGSVAAAKLTVCANAQGVEVVTYEPKGSIPTDAKSVDWLDVLNQHGPNAFNRSSL